MTNQPRSSAHDAPSKEEALQTILQNKRDLDPKKMRTITDTGRPLIMSGDLSDVKIQARGGESKKFVRTAQNWHKINNPSIPQKLKMSSNVSDFRMLRPHAGVNTQHDFTDE